MNNWEPVFSNGVCVGVGEVKAKTFLGNYHKMVCNSVLPETDEEYEEERNEIVRNMNLIAAAPMMLETLKEIARGQGRYATDRLQHATNTIEDMVNLAQEAVNKVEPF